MTEKNNQNTSVSSASSTTAPQITVRRLYGKQYERYSKNWTAYGRFMYRLCYSWAFFLNRPQWRWLFYVLTYTWGIITTVIGLLISLVLLITGHKPLPYHGIWYFKVFDWWGGFEMGPMFVRDKKSADKYINPHEFGHCFGQSSLLGPFMLLLVSLPSATRYWIQEFRDRRNERLHAQGRDSEVVANPDYDNIWFEASATDIGDMVVELREAELAKKEAKEAFSSQPTAGATTAAKEAAKDNDPDKK